MPSILPSKLVSEILMLHRSDRHEFWEHVISTIESYSDRVSTLPIRAEIDPAEVRRALELIDFESPLNPVDAVALVATVSCKYQTHTGNPRYFGLFDPAPTTMGIAAEALAAAFNPQLAVWSQSPAAIEMEQLLVRVFGEKFGYESDCIDGTFASGGAEANHTALLTALTHSFPDFRLKGVRALSSSPVLYISSEGHHSVLKAARLCGLGDKAVREIPVDSKLRMDVDALSAQITEDRSTGLIPFLVVATAGTTNAGAVDPLVPISQVAARERLWLHTDAAWGGAAVLVPEVRSLLDGIEQSDSITFDPHKWLSMPRGAGLYITRHKEILGSTFQVVPAYMPRQRTAGLDVIDPFMHSMQWSRRFIGLPMFLTLLVVGWEGYAGIIRHQIAMGKHLRRELENADWKVVNDTALAVVCFFDASSLHYGRTTNYLEAVAEEVVSSGQAWISTTRLAGDQTVLRACITNYRTTLEDVGALVQILNRARERVLSGFDKTFSKENMKNG